MQSNQQLCCCFTLPCLGACFSLSSIYAVSPLLLQLQNWSCSLAPGSSSSNGNSRSSEIDLLVPRGQLSIGKALIKALYFPEPDLTSLTQQQQLQLLRLAESYGVFGVVHATMKALVACGDMLEAEVAMAVFDLPGSCERLAFHKQLKSLAFKALGLADVLWDLEDVWPGAALEDSDAAAAAAGIGSSRSRSGAVVAAAGAGSGAAAAAPPNDGSGARRSSRLAATITAGQATPRAGAAVGTVNAADAANAADDDDVALRATDINQFIDNSRQQHERLLSMPFSVFVYLFTQQNVRVSSEDIVYYTIVRWLRVHSETTGDQIRKLAAVLRLPQCTATYLSTIVCSSSSWIRQYDVFSPEELLMASAACNRNWYIFSRDPNGWHSTNCPDYIKRNPAWGLGPRDDSAVDGIDLVWDLPLRELEEAVIGCDGGLLQLVQQRGRKVWKGRELALGLILQADHSIRDKVHVQVGVVFCSSPCYPAGGMTWMAGEVGFKGKEGPQMDEAMGEATVQVGGTGIARAGEDLAAEGLTEGRPGRTRAFNWEALVGALQKQGYVLEGEFCLRMHGRVEQLQ